MIIQHNLSTKEKLFNIFENQANLNCMAATHLKDLMEYFRRLNLITKDVITDKEHKLIVQIINQRELSHIVRKIRELEQEGYIFFRDFVAILNKTLVTPIDSDDLYNFSQELHLILGHIYSAAFRIELYNAKWPDKFCYKLVNILVDMTEESKTAIGILKSMGSVKPHLHKLMTLERKGSEAYIDGMSILFNTEDDMEVMKWNDIYIKIRQAIRACTELSEKIETMIIKYG